MVYSRYEVHCLRCDSCHVKSPIVRIAPESQWEKQYIGTSKEVEQQLLDYFAKDGWLYHEQAILCQSCGGGKEWAIKCSHCEARNSPNAKSCYKCGREL